MHLGFTSFSGRQWAYGVYSRKIQPRGEACAEDTGPFGVGGAPQDGRLFSGLASVPMAAFEDVAERGPEQLVINCTEACNLRCGYCVFSGEYHYQRVHSGRRASNWATAQVLREFLDAKRKWGGGTASVGFYGGEPSLMFGLISEMVDLVNTEYADVRPRVVFAITSNGVGWRRGFIEFLVREGFAVTVSLDGPASIHDEWRRDAAGHPTHKRVIDSLLSIRNQFPDFFARNVQLSTTVGFPRRLLERRDYFRNESWLAGLRQRVSFVDACETATMEIVADRHHGEYSELSTLATELVEAFRVDDYLGSSFERALFGEALGKLRAAQNDSAIESKRPWANGSCLFGGRRVFVTTDGALLPCEKLFDDPTLHIGAAGRGVDPGRASSLFERYRSESEQDCVVCPIAGVCDLCITAGIGDGGFSIERKRRQCVAKRQYTRLVMRLYASLIEASQDDNRFKRWFPVPGQN